MNRIDEEKCVACRKNSPGLSDSEIAELKCQVDQWEVIKRDTVSKLERTFRFYNFSDALAFTTKIGEIAEAEDHHPSILTEWGKVTVTWWTHAIGGLHRNDFIMAGKTDRIFDMFARV
jgi:4a-hydroxytetrahydrobiopterin dehydratase